MSLQDKHPLQGNTKRDTGEAVNEVKNEVKNGVSHMKASSAARGQATKQMVLRGNTRVVEK